MKQRFSARGGTIDGLLLEVWEDEWAARLLDRPGEGAGEGADPMVLLSLPGSLFLAHDAAMAAMGAHGEPAFRTDAEYLAEVWGFTALDDEALMPEAGDVPLLGIRVLPDGIAVDIAGYPWLFREHPGRTAAEWRRVAREGRCLLGICLDVDLDGGAAEDVFLDELARGRAVLGLVRVVGQL